LEVNAVRGPATSWLSSLLLLPVLLTALPVLVIVASVLLPGGGASWLHLWQTVLTEYVVHSLWLAAGVACGTLLLGVGPAWLVTMCRFPGSRLLAFLLLLPLAVPGYVIAYVYAGLLDAAGPVQAWLNAWGMGALPPIRSLAGAVIMLSLVLYPYVYLLARAAFIEQSCCALEAARTLGCNGVSAFLRVGLPLARPLVAAGLALVVMEALADYGTVQYYGVTVFTTGIFRTWEGLGDSLAATQLATVLLVFVLVLFGMERRLRQRARYHHTSNEYRPLAPPRLGVGAGWLACLACSLPVVFGFLLPGGVLLAWAVRSYGDGVQADFLPLLLHSLGLALLTSLLALSLALLLQYRCRLQRGLFNGILVNAVRMGYAVPGTVIAIGVIIPALWFDELLTRAGGAVFAHSPAVLTGSLALLVFAYLVRFLAVALNTVEAGMAKIRPSMEEAGRSLGASLAGIVRRVQLPIMRGSMLTALLLVFVDVLKELPATLLLRPFDFNTLAVRVYELANEERLVEAAFPALSIVAAGIVPVALLSFAIAHARPGSRALP